MRESARRMMHFLFRQRKVHEMPKVSVILALLTICSVGIAAPPFEFDRQLAVELARAYIHSQLRVSTNEEADRISYDKPLVVATVASKGRHLVSVTFASTGGPAGAYVLLERCEETGLLLAVDVGTVDNLASYRRDMGSVTSKTYVALPQICPATDAP
jgi:hypothetical protein